MYDVIVRSKGFERQLESLEKVLAKLLAAGLKMRPDKCQLFRRKVKFLGHVVSKNGVEPDPEKISAVANWCTPTNKGELASFIGLVSYYQKFIEDYSTTASPLFALASKYASWKWTKDCEESFCKLKRALTSAPILAYPQFGEGHGQFILDVDASDVAMGAVMSQVQDGQERVLAYGHKSLNTTWQA